MDVPHAVGAHEDADPEVDEQAGEPAARGDPHGRDRDQEHQRAGEQELVEVVDSQRRIPSLARAGAHVGSRTQDTEGRRTAPDYFVTLPNS
ncbi:hypothetical protein GCM10017776_38650 [Streptomyces griseoluteus]|nr:hypothetical protein GCM10017776_38650 [Streptomyces griseoluteus]